MTVTPIPFRSNSGIKACYDDSADCILLSLKSLLRKRPYTGDKRCYDLDDLKVIAEDCDVCDGFRYSANAIPFLRNEVFARKGYTFKTDMLKKFFFDMPWYKPAGQDVTLNDVEKWNVDFLRKVEDAKLSDEKKLSKIYEQLKQTCP